MLKSLQSSLASWLIGMMANSFDSEKLGRQGVVWLTALMAETHGQ